jgi:hypothetical protein
MNFVSGQQLTPLPTRATINQDLVWRLIELALDRQIALAALSECIG